MKRAVKWFLGATVAVLGLIIIAFVAVAVWIARTSPEFEARFIEARKAGIAAAALASPDHCLSELPSRLDQCAPLIGPLDCRMIEGEFLSACLLATGVSERFCATVPTEKDENGTLHWASGFCHSDSGFDFEVCRRVLYAAQYHCDVKFPNRDQQ